MNRELSAEERLGDRIVLENERIRVWEENIPVGAVTPVHTHRRPFLALVLQGGVIEAIDTDGQVGARRTREAGQLFYCDESSLPFGHSVRNVGEQDIKLFIVEFLAPGTGDDDRPRGTPIPG